MSNIIAIGTSLTTGRKKQLEPGDVLVNTSGGPANPPSAIFGDGSDGAFILDGVNLYPAYFTYVAFTNEYFASRDIFATTFLVTNGKILITTGSRIFARTSLTVDLGATINSSSIPYAKGTNGSNSNSGPSGGYGYNTNTLGGVNSFQVGGDGGASLAGTSGGSQINSLGGAGGAGGAGVGTAGGSGGTATIPAGVTLLGLTDAISGTVLLPPSTPTSVSGGAAGGGGGGGSATGGGNYNTGGSGGGGGGVMMLAAPTINNNGEIKCPGGNGGNGFADGGGGGGGGGGVVITITNSGSVLGNLPTVAGGIGGTGNVAGTNGSPGSYFPLIGF